MLYDLDNAVYLTQTRYSRVTLVATIEQRRNLLSVLSSYRHDSLKDGYACGMSEGPTRTRDRARALQLWNHGVLNQDTIALCFGVTRRTLQHYWGANSRGRHDRMYGRINPDHCDFLLELLDHHSRYEPLPMTDDSVMAVLCSDPDPKLHTNLTAAANLLGVTRDGGPRDNVGITHSEIPAPPPLAPVLPTRVVHMDDLPTQAEVAKAEPVTTIDDADIRDAVEAGDVPYAPEIDFDDTGDSLLADLDPEEIEAMDEDDLAASQSTDE